MKTYAVIFCMLIGGSSSFLSCSSRISEPLEGRFIPKNNMIARGQSLYNIHCQKCHPGGESGLGPAINWNPAPSFIKKFQVRHGLGVMPAFKADEISKEDLDAIGKYMKAFKHQKRTSKPERN
ncbi:MAG TPA: cytochrome c [Segetibacter sp.]